MKIRYFVKITLPYLENQVNNFDKPITDSNSSTPKTFDQTLSKFVILFKTALPYSENQVNNFEKLITDSNSSTSKIFDQTLSKVVILLK